MTTASVFLTGLVLCCLGAEPAQPPLVDTSSVLETISTEFGLADGPSWDGRGTLYIPDVKGQKLYRFQPRTGKLQAVLPEAGRISATFYNHGQLFLADNGESRISVLQGKQKLPLIANANAVDPDARPNDLVVDNAGGVYFTLTKQGEVRYIDRSGRMQTAVAKIETPNGIALSPDGATLYVSAYVPKQVWAYDVKSEGVVDGGRLFAAMDDGPEKGADGMTIDRAGNVYCAGATDVWIWNPDGKLMTKIATPTRPINCTFGDSDMQSLYITGFGGLYRQKMNISGRAPQPVSSGQDSNAVSQTVPSTAIPENVKPHFDVVYAQYGPRKVLADIFVPVEGSGPRAAIVVVHGGGWLKGDKAKFRALAVALASRGYVTAAIEYRLGGEALFPAAIHDCNAAVRYLRAHAAEYGIDPERIGAVGGSAGGHLVGLMATAAGVPELQGRGGNAEQSSRLQAAIVMAGPMELMTGSVAERSRRQPDASNTNRWLGATLDEAPERYRLADAFVHISKETPPLLFMTGELDNPSRNAPARKKLQQAGVWTDVKIYKDGKHGCWNQLPWFDDMVADMDAFFGEHLR